ncbi:MAG: glutamine--fructose-6-phosphate transaminase (isomerizing) [Pseudomonadota bacterium]
MCGIVGYLGPRDSVGILLDCLKKLEYRGYDSAGLATINGGRIDVRRTLGKIISLEEMLSQRPLSGCCGIGHTRWATHGRPSDINAHPHCCGDVAVVHNGIIENYQSLKQRLVASGRTFISETDTEIAAHLIDEALGQGLGFEAAVRAALSQIEGSYALVVLSRREPRKIICARKESPLIVGLGEGETFIASDVPALLAYTRRVIFLDDDQLAIVSPEGVRLESLGGERVEPRVETVSWSPTLAERAGYKHFMLKEIFEQPRALTDTVRGRVMPGSAEVCLDAPGLDARLLSEIKRIFIVACGTSYHAGLVGKFLIEQLARVPVEVDLASEFRYRDPMVGPDCLLVLISQSGETADTLAALREGKAKGVHTLGICNAVGSSLSRGCEWVLYTHAGPEIGVASTKAFTTQLALLFLLAIHVGSTNGKLPAERRAELLDDLAHLPRQMEEVLKLDEAVLAVARQFMNAQDFLYLGRGIQYPIALEGALKLKEISYIHAEGYPAGEMKHGPIALIDERMPVVVIAPDGENVAKICSNIEEIRARRARIIVLSEETAAQAVGAVDASLILPRVNPLLKPLLYVVPLQLLAYHIAVLRGTDVDQPRNLAKSVTVE